MNKSLILALALAVPLTVAARADDHHNRNHRSAEQEAEQAHYQAARQQSAHTVPYQQSVRRTNPMYPPHHISTATRSNTNPVYTRTVPNTSHVYTGATVNNDRFRDRNRENTAHVNSNVAVQRNGAHRDYNRNSYATARSRVVHTHHDRNWWRSHYNTTFVLFGGGYYYWNDGYWYPAFGYDPYYNNYAYSEPIYGYNDLPPGQVLENVQLALRDLGYYHGAIDGLVGPETRAALAAYQRENGLVVTEAVDEPTLVTLGLA